MKKEGSKGKGKGLLVETAYDCLNLICARARVAKYQDEGSYNSASYYGICGSSLTTAWNASRHNDLVRSCHCASFEQH